jgi:hypothetical protein
MVLDLFDIFSNYCQDKTSDHALSEANAISSAIISRVCNFDELNSSLMENGVCNNGIFNILHWSALAVQVLCLSLLSYTRAHTGSFHPFFLIDPLSRIDLFGALDFNPSYPHVVAQLQRFTCMDDMTKDPVLVFQSSMFQPRSGLETNSYNLLASPVDIVDT